MNGRFPASRWWRGTCRQKARGSAFPPWCLQVSGDASAKTFLPPTRPPMCCFTFVPRNVTCGYLSSFSSKYCLISPVVHGLFSLPIWAVMWRFTLTLGIGTTPGRVGANRLVSGILSSLQQLHPTCWLVCTHLRLPGGLRSQRSSGQLHAPVAACHTSLAMSPQLHKQQQAALGAPCGRVWSNRLPGGQRGLPQPQSSRTLGSRLPLLSLPSWCLLF